MEKNKIPLPHKALFCFWFTYALLLPSFCWNFLGNKSGIETAVRNMYTHTYILYIFFFLYLKMNLKFNFLHEPFLMLSYLSFTSRIDLLCAPTLHSTTWSLSSWLIYFLIKHLPPEGRDYTYSFFFMGNLELSCYEKNLFI